MSAEDQRKVATQYNKTYKRNIFSSASFKDGRKTFEPRPWKTHERKISRNRFNVGMVIILLYCRLNGLVVLTIIVSEE